MVPQIVLTCSVATILLVLTKTALTLSLPLSANITASNANLGALKDRCVTNEYWTGACIKAIDCKNALIELYNADVQPRPQGQEYEFYVKGGPRDHFPLPTVVTPRSHEWGEHQEFAFDQ